MDNFFVPGILGVILIVLGIMNMKGNISSLHWYHRQRVTEEDRKPFGKLVGLGTLIIGIAFVLSGILFWISEVTSTEIWLIIGCVITVGGIVVGLGLSFYILCNLSLKCGLAEYILTKKENRTRHVGTSH